MVIEKQSRMKETLKMTGVATWVLDGSKYFTYFWSFFPITLGVAMLNHYGDLFTNIGIAHLTLFLIFLLMAMAAMAKVIGGFFNETRPAVISTLVLIIGLSTLSFKLFGDSFSNQMAASLITPICLFLGINSVIHGSSYGRGFEYASAVKDDSSMININYYILMFIVQFVLYNLIAWYLENVVPQEHGVARKWDFIFQKEFWIKESGSDADTIELNCDLKEKLNGYYETLYSENRCLRKSTLPFQFKRHI
jgi:ATP-binding cassette subfamily A (ABC1) protein 3